MKNLSLAQFVGITLFAGMVGFTIHLLGGMGFGLWVLEHRLALGVIGPIPGWHHEMMIFPALLTALLLWSRGLHEAAGVHRR